MSLQIGLISVCNSICKWRLTANHTCSSNRLNEVSTNCWGFFNFFFLNKGNYILQYNFRNFHSKRKYPKEQITPVQKTLQYMLLMRDQSTLVERYWFAQIRIPEFSMLNQKTTGKGDRIFTSLCVRSDKCLNTHTVAFYVMYSFITNLDVIRT